MRGFFRNDVNGLKKSGGKEVEIRREVFSELGEEIAYAISGLQ